AGCGFDKRIEHGLEIERRAANDFEYVSGRGPLLSPFVKFLPKLLNRIFVRVCNSRHSLSRSSARRFRSVFPTVPSHLRPRCAQVPVAAIISRVRASPKALLAPIERIYVTVISGRCPLWVKSRHVSCKTSCLLYTQ